MKQTLLSKRCEEFIHLLASPAPVPGGGGAAALAGALGAALCSMAGNLTVGQKKFSQVEEGVQSLLVQCQTIQARLMELADQDAASFEPLSRAYAMPKEDPARAGVLERAALAACQPPLDIMRGCGQAIELLEAMAQVCNPALISDVGCGAHLCRAALESASLNIFANTRTLRDRRQADALEVQAQDMLAGYPDRAEQICKVVRAHLLESR